MAAGILDDRPPLGSGPLRAAIRRAHRAGEASCVAGLLAEAAVDPERRAEVGARAQRLARRVREAGGDQLGVEAFLHEYSLSTREGIMLMCLAEALLRIPDGETRDRLIRDKLGLGDWAHHLGHSDSLLVNASTWGLMLTGRFVRVDLAQGGEVGPRFTRLVQRLGEPVVRQAILQAMRVLGRHFVLGQTIEAAIQRAREAEQTGYRYSYDMLGEAARTMADAERYQVAYRDAIAAIVKAARGADLMARPGISIKLSALHPRYEIAQHERLGRELLPRVLALLAQARAGNIAVTIDAEESDRLEPSLDLFERLAAAPELAGWDGLGLAVQAYQKRAIHVIDWLQSVARRQQRRRIPVRLVKGAYWDTEIKRAQELGLEGYPVFTRKLATDVSYLACAGRLLAGGGAFYPQFATHNAQTLASIVELRGRPARFRVPAPARHGRGALRGAADGRMRPTSHAGSMLRSAAIRISCRTWCGGCSRTAPIRRSSTGSSTRASRSRAWSTTRCVRLARIEPKANPKIPLPPALYGAGRRNSSGLDLTDPAELERLAGRDRCGPRRRALTRGPAAAGAASGCCTIRLSAARVIGRVIEADEATVDRAVTHGRPRVSRLGRARGRRPGGLSRAGGRSVRGQRAELLALCVREAGKTLVDAVAELREAVDFLRYYAAEARARGAARGAARPDRREQRARAARPRRVRRDQPLELPARDLHRADRRGACGRQCRGRQARAADPADRGTGD